MLKAKTIFCIHQRWKEYLYYLFVKVWINYIADSVTNSQDVIPFVFDRKYATPSNGFGMNCDIQWLLELVTVVLLPL